MKRIKVAVCDLDDIYRERLAAYFLRRKGENIQTYTFSGVRTFLSVLQEEEMDIALLGGGFEDVFSRKDWKKRLSLVIHMTENREAEDTDDNTIYKYQSAEEILRRIYQRYQKLGQADSYLSVGKKEILAIYSPSQSMLRTPFALTLAQTLSEEKRVLYVNLGEWSGFEPWMQEQYQRDLADLIYLLTDYGKEVRGMLESVTYSLNRIDYIPPARDAQLLTQIGPKDYRKLLHLLVNKTDYEVILLDFGIMVPGFFELLEQCTRICGVTMTSPLAKKQWNQFEESIMRQEKLRIAEKLQSVVFSLSDLEILEEEPVLQRWSNGIIGCRARAVRYAMNGED